MPTNRVEDLSGREYKYGFVTEIEAEAVSPRLNEDTIRLISAAKIDLKDCRSSLLEEGRIQSLVGSQE